MRITFIFFFTFFILFSCSKEIRVSKKLDGNWTVDFIQVQDGEGFTYFDSLPKGTFTFNSNQKVINAIVVYQFVNLNGFNVKDTFRVNNENYDFNSRCDRIFFKVNSDTINARIILLTEKSMELEYYDTVKCRLVRFILSQD